MIERGDLIGRGRTSHVYSVGQHDVVKVPRPGVPAHWAQIEAELTAAVHELGVPTPAVRGLTDVDGRSSIVFERIHGESLWAHMKDRPEDLANLARDLASIHCAVQAERAPSRLPDLKIRICTKIDRAHQLAPSERRAATSLVHDLPGGESLCHGDMHPGNILMSDRGPVIIDWFDAAAGAAAADIARTSLLIRPPGSPETVPAHLPGADAEIMHVLHSTYLETIYAAPARDRAETERWEPVIAASRLAEGAQADESELLAQWHRHAGAGERANR